jgi:hypothetical protein
MRTVEIKVTQEDIDRGVSTDCTKCPIALACIRSVPSIESCLVDPREIAFFPPRSNIWVDVKTPYAAVRFMREFDGGHPVSPFSFTLELPEELFAEVAK